jgi:hypothetical protein
MAPRPKPLGIAGLALAALWIGTPLARAADPIAVPLHIDFTADPGNPGCRVWVNVAGALDGVTIRRVVLKFEIGPNLGTAAAELVEPGRWRAAAVTFRGYCDSRSVVRVVGVAECSTQAGAVCVPSMASTRGRAVVRWGE